METKPAAKRLGRPRLRVLKPKDVTELRRERVRTKATFRELAAKHGNHRLYRL
jgi:hypothetical protein